jgi:DNA-binding transcriptional LysR family regulator
LEADLGVLLLSRSRRFVALTPAGAVLLHEAGLLLQRMDETVRRVQRTAAGEEGELRLGYIGPPTQMFLGRILKDFRARHPRVSVVLEERTPERVWEMVARGRLAVGITRPVLSHRALGLPSLLLRKEPLVCAFPAEHRFAKMNKVAWRGLADEPIVLLARREGVGLHDAILAACRRARFTPRLAHTPSLISTVFSYVEAGAGVGVVTDSVCPLDTNNPLIFRPLVPTHTVDLVMVWSDQDDSPSAAAFRNLVETWRREGRLWNSFPDSKRKSRAGERLC